MQLVFKQTNTAEKAWKLLTYIVTHKHYKHSCQKLNKASAFKKREKKKTILTLQYIEIPFCEFLFLLTSPWKS